MVKKVDCTEFVCFILFLFQKSSLGINYLP